MITEIMENDNNLLGDQITFQLEGASPYYTFQFQEFLNERFPARQIGGRGAKEWRVIFPDLNPVDFFLWGPLKSTVYASQPNNIRNCNKELSVTADE